MRKKVLAISILLTGVLGAFQNCAPRAPHSTESAELGEIYMKDAEDECAWMDEIAPSLSSQPEGTVISGGAILQSYGSHLASIKDGTGVIHLKGKTSDAVVNEIKNFQGTVYLCDMNITSLSNFEGNVFVVRGNIESIDGFTGNIVVINGSINKVENSVGQISIRTLDGKKVFRTLESPSQR